MGPSSGRATSGGAEHLDVRLLRFRNRPDREEPALLALELIAAGRTHDALEVVDLALRRDPEDVDVLLGCGIAAARSGQLAFAQWVLTRAAKAAPDWVEPRRWLARVLVMRGKHARAVDVARCALAAGDDAADIAEMVRRDDRRRALDARIEAFRRDRDVEEPALLAADLLADERAADALAVARLGLASEEDPDLRVAEARALLALGDREGAERSLEMALDQAPAWEEPVRMLCDLLLDRGALPEALSLVERALAATPASEALRDLRARVEVAMRAAGVEHPAEQDTALDQLLATRDTVDPISDQPRSSLAHRFTAGSRAAPRGGRGARPGWLSRVARWLFGLAPSAPGARAAPCQAVRISPGDT
jgi:Flp pilus assembly protein TadD